MTHELATDGFWERNPHAAQESQWTSEPVIAKAVYRAISQGISEEHWLSWLFQMHFAERSFAKVLSIGCGVGDHEIAMASFPNVERIDAFDFSSESIRIAISKSEVAGTSKINFYTGDFNHILVEENAYDLILCSGSLHHVKNLEHLLGQVRGGLKDGGFFIANEYVGSCYNIYSNQQLDVINNVLSKLPVEVLCQPEAVLHNPTIEAVFERDPTEAVRSKIIPDFLRIYFRSVDERAIGGHLLHPIYPFLNVNYLAGNDVVRESIFNLLVEMDGFLRAAGSSDFSFFICEKTTD